jgi:nitroreductase
MSRQDAGRDEPGGPDSDTVRTALELAVRAPSVHNSQPWCWCVDTGALHLYTDETRHLPYTDPDRRDLVISCGICLHHAVIAFAALGWHVRITRRPSPADPTHLATLRFSPSKPENSELACAAAIQRRRTDRRTFSPWLVSPADVGLIGARVARMGVSLRRVDPTPLVRAVMSEARYRHAADPNYAQELAEWSSRHESRPDGRLTQPPGSSMEDDGAGLLIVLGTHDDDEMAWMRAGEATSQALLTATSVGLATCPLTEPLEIPETRAALREELFDGADHPQMILRMGWAPIDAAPLPVTARRGVGDVMTVSGAGRGYGPSAAIMAGSTNRTSRRGGVE